jgi:hypothetical protein
MSADWNRLHALLKEACEDNALELTPLEWHVLHAARQLAFDAKMRLDFPQASPAVHGRERI